MQLTDSLKSLLVETAKSLKGAERRRFMARTVKELGPGGQRRAAVELGWNRDTIRKGMRELESGVPCQELFRMRGRKPIEERLPNLLEDITAIVESDRQTDSCFNSRPYTRLSAAEVRRRLLQEKHYSDAELPSAETIRIRLHQLGYRPARAAKTQPKSSKPSHLYPQGDLTGRF